MQDEHNQAVCAVRNVADEKHKHTEELSSNKLQVHKTHMKRRSRRCRRL